MLLDWRTFKWWKNDWNKMEIFTWKMESFDKSKLIIFIFEYEFIFSVFSQSKKVSLKENENINYDFKLIHLEPADE